MKRRIYIIQATVKEGVTKDLLPLSIIESLLKGGATIDNPIYFHRSYLRRFTNDINYSTTFDYEVNAEHSMFNLKSRYPDFNFKVITCEAITEIHPIGTELSPV